ncbi:MAG: outer membrane beta-barrel protein [Cytophagales bacterium]
MKYFAYPFLCLFLCAIFTTQAQQEQVVASVKKIPSYSSSETSIVTAGEQQQQAEEPKEEEKPKFTYSGYFDTYYFANLNTPASRNNLGSSGIGRGFDRYAGQFQLGMFLNRMSYAYKNTEVVAEIGFGPNVEYGSYGSDFRYKWGTVIANNTYSALMIKQAYINYKATSKLTFTMGQFGTHIGYEMIDAPLNFHYSINNTFNAGIPFYHLGLKATYAFSDKVSLMGGVVNGTDNVNDNNRGKSFIGQLTLNPAKGLTVYLNTIQGNEANARTSGQDTTSYFGVLDLVATYQVSERLQAAIWVMQGTASGEFQGGTYFNETKHWSGANLYVSYKFSDLFSLGTRLEYFDNTSGARALLTNGKGTDVKTYTLTGNFYLADGRLNLKPEFRFDDFMKMTGPAGEDEPQQFMDSNGNFTKSTQATLGMAVVYKF